MTLPSWLDPLPDAAQQRAIDSWAIEDRGIPGETLMERAGTALANFLADRVSQGPIAIVCGKGNNGGDGQVAARVLRERGRDVQAFDGSISATDLSGSVAIVDALLGTGTSGPPREQIAAAIELINAAGEAGAQVIACDIPSGVNGSTGEVPGAAVRAQHTITFHAAKPGLWINPGKHNAGTITVIDIGIPAGDPIEPTIGLLTDRVLAVVPRRSGQSDKFTAGSVLVVGGSPRFTGAPVMAARAAARAGAGYVTVATAADAAPVIASKLLEVMTVALESGSEAEQALKLAEKSLALIVGPGLGEHRDLARGTFRHLQRPLVLDADGLNAHAGHLAELRERGGPTVLTPHSGELSRLLAVDRQNVDAHRLSSAQRAAELSGCVVVLKGDDTLIVGPEGLVAVSPGGAPALATAGTGDVLSGVLGAFLAKGMEPFTAACAAVELHRGAGRLAAEVIGAEGVIASDVIELLPRAWG
jgi:NAD(P)H-hydrate epimerase